MGCVNVNLEPMYKYCVTNFNYMPDASFFETGQSLIHHERTKNMARAMMTRKSVRLSLGVLLHSYFPICFVAAEASTVSVVGRAAFFEWEDIQATGHSNTALIHRRKTSNSINAVVQRQCKVFPGDEDWPTDTDWRTFNETLGGTLLKPIPQSSVCWENTIYSDYSPSQCAAVTANFNMFVNRTFLSICSRADKLTQEAQTTQLRLSFLYLQASAVCRRTCLTPRAVHR